MNDHAARTVGSLSQRAIFMQIVAFALLIGLLYVVFPSVDFTFMPVLLGAGIYLIWSRLAALLFLSHHRAGVQFLRVKAYPQAIQSFQQSDALFKASPWLDRHRWLTLLSPSSISYREMALNNLAYAYLQLGKGKEARAAYQTLVDEIPDGMMVESAREVIARIDAQVRR
jgi:tetratricopeptide (TPR) repeat protein